MVISLNIGSASSKIQLGHPKVYKMRVQWVEDFVRVVELLDSDEIGVAD